VCALHFREKDSLFEKMLIILNIDQLLPYFYHLVCNVSTIAGYAAIIFILC
jgi:hypothetical protein